MSGWVQNTFIHGEVTFNFIKKWIYTILASLIAVPVSVLTGVLIGVFQAWFVWVIMPCFRLTLNYLKAFVAPYVRLSVKFWLTPIATALGQFFNAIRIKMS